jgi:hypothetical protein
VIRVHDVETGFSQRNPKRNRPYVVVGLSGRMVRVVPHSTTDSRGVWTPADVIEGLEEGHFVPTARLIAMKRLVTRRPIGYLPDPYLSDVIEQAKPRRDD